MYIQVQVTAGAKQETFTQKDETHFVATVKEKAERNMANKRVIELMRQQFPQATRIQIVSGHHSPSKLFSVNIEGS